MYCVCAETIYSGDKCTWGISLLQKWIYLCFSDQVAEKLCLLGVLFSLPQIITKIFLLFEIKSNLDRVFP